MFVCIQYCLNSLVQYPFFVHAFSSLPILFLFSSSISSPSPLPSLPPSPLSLLLLSPLSPPLFSLSSRHLENWQWFRSALTITLAVLIFFGCLCILGALARGLYNVSATYLYPDNSPYDHGAHQAGLLLKKYVFISETPSELHVHVCD